MTIDLTSYKSIQSNLFVRIEIDEYKVNPGDSYTSTVLRFSDLLHPFTLNSESYAGLGKLMSITETASELRVSGGELTITISGIPNTSIFEIVNSKIKGSPIQIYRGLFNSSTGAYLSSLAGNPVGRFTGFINNYSLNEDYDVDSRTSSNTLVLTCASNIDVLNSKIAGRRTNPESQKSFYSTDLGMDRVTSLAQSEFNFGAPA